MTGVEPGLDRLIGDLAAENPARELGDGEILCHVGDDSNDAFVIVAGVIEALMPIGGVETVVATHQAGALIGEVTTVVGGPRTATLRASGPTTVSVVPKAALSAWLDDRPAAARTVLDTARGGADRSRAAEMLCDSLGIDDHALAVAIADRLVIEPVASGTTVVERDATADSAGLLISGRVIIDDGAGGSTEHARGTMVGADALFGDPSPVAVTTTRDSTVGWLRCDAFAELLSAHPRPLLGLVRQLSTQERANTPDLGRTIVVLTAGPGGPELVSTMVAAVSKRASALLLDPTTVDTLLETPGVSQRTGDEPGNRRVEELLHQAEVDHDVVILHAEPDDHGWRERAIRQSDQVVVWTDGPPTPPVEAHVATARQLAPTTPRWLAIRHGAGVVIPQGTVALQQRLGVTEVLHARHGRIDDIERVGRLAAGVGVGLVLSGGGGRGFAHIGAIRSLLERGVPIDRIAGASMGSVIAGGVALGHEGDDLVDQVERQFHKLLDYTVPLVSVLKGQRIAHNIVEIFGVCDIEDLWIPFACVTTNLTRNRVEFHRTGSLAVAIRASVAIPGILPPVPWGDDLLIDGGVLDNLPLDVLADDPSIGTLVAIDVAPPRGPRARTDYGLSVSGWSAFRDRFPRHKRRLPTLSSVLMRSMSVGSARQRDEWLASDTADLYLYLDLAGVGLLDFQNVRPVADRGYQAADPEIAAWLASAPAPTR